MSLPATEDFDAFNDGDALETSSDWVMVIGSMDVQVQGGDGEVRGDDNVQHGARWVTDTPDADQYATLTLEGTISGFMGPACRASGSGTATDGNFYGWYGESGTYLSKVIEGSWTQIGAAGAASSTGDVMRLEVSGTTLTPMVNGAELDPPGAQTDATIASGSGGLSGFSTGHPQGVGDTWETGNLAGAPAEDYTGSIASRHFATLRGE
jgi:hypothetical protein